MSKSAYVVAAATVPARARLAYLPWLTIDSPLMGGKVRTAGRVLAVDHVTEDIILEHDGTGIVVNISPCLSTEHQSRVRGLEQGFMPRVRDVVMIVGDFERREAPDDRLPEITLPYPKPRLDGRVVVNAIMLVPTRDDTDLNLHEWREHCEMANEE